jgi:hypothetical protein
MDIYDSVRHYIYSGKKTFQSLSIQEKREFVIADLSSEDSDGYDLLIQHKDQTIIDFMRLTLQKTITAQHAIEATLDGIAKRSADRYEKYFSQIMREFLLESVIRADALRGQDLNTNACYL